jgi:hypothetical protein
MPNVLWGIVSKLTSIHYLCTLLLKINVSVDFTKFNKGNWDFQSTALPTELRWQKQIKIVNNLKLL